MIDQISSGGNDIIQYHNITNLNIKKYWNLSIDSIWWLIQRFVHETCANSTDKKHCWRVLPCMSSVQPQWHSQSVKHPIASQFLGLGRSSCVFHHFPPHCISFSAVQSQSTAMPGLFSSTTKRQCEMFILQPFSYYPWHLLMSHLRSHSLE